MRPHVLFCNGRSRIKLRKAPNWALSDVWPDRVTNHALFADTVAFVGLYYLRAMGTKQPLLNKISSIVPCVAC